MRVVFLGTSAGMPTTERSLPALAMVASVTSEVLLFDCGEGTQVQLRRAHLRPGKLTRILISHLHGDHVTGLMGLLLTLQMLGRTEPLDLYGPRGLERYVMVSRELLEAGWAYETRFHEVTAPGLVVEDPNYQVTCDWLQHRSPTLGYLYRERDRPGRVDVERAAALGLEPGPLLGALQRGETVTAPSGRVVAPEEVVGPVRPGLRVAYVADTRPCEAAVRLARNADLLVHEGTFDESLSEDARQKSHSTAVEAAQVARSAEVRRLVLTHISPRYSEPEVLRAQASRIFPNSTVARDLEVIEITLAS